MRGEVGRFVREMCCGPSEVTLRMFIACRGLPVLASYAAANYNSRPLLVATAIDAVRQVFSAHTGGTQSVAIFVLDTKKAISNFFLQEDLYRETIFVAYLRVLDFSHR